MLLTLLAAVQDQSAACATIGRAKIMTQSVRYMCPSLKTVCVRAPLVCPAVEGHPVAAKSCTLSGPPLMPLFCAHNRQAKAAGGLTGYRQPKPGIHEEWGPAGNICLSDRSLAGHSTSQSSFKQLNLQAYAVISTTKHALHVAYFLHSTHRKRNYCS